SMRRQATGLGYNRVRSREENFDYVSGLPKPRRVVSPVVV
ncbi:hypothetical protein SAMN02990966_01826, partial [Rhodospirillales bacterium URHD0017]